MLVVTGTAHADLVLYTVPGTEITLKLMGKVTVNVGGTVSCRHERGTLHFSLSDCQIVRTQSNQKIYGSKSSAARREGTAQSHLDLALWCVEQGMLEEADKELAEAWKADPNNPQVRLMVQLVKYRRATVPSSASIEQEMRQFVKSDSMKVARSRHYILLHDCSDADDPIYGKPIAQHRLDLLEKVYDSFYMKYALEGHPLRVPREPMRVVLFNDHADYLNFVRILSPSLKMAAGFYSPEENIAIFYRQKTDEAYEGADQLVEILKGLREEVRRNPSAAGGEIIRLAKTVELLVDIEGENKEIEVVTHEATHQLAANSGLLDREKFQVRWAHEGLASYFESPKEATWAGIGAVNEQRLGYYRILSHDPEHSSLEFVVTDRIFDYASTNGSVMSAYGQAWALTHYLMNEHLNELLAFYKKMAVDDFKVERDDAWRDKTFATFKECFGDIETLELEWRRYMRDLKTDDELLADKL
ncbi:hypothetical protein Poly51_27810 [Rubripirellula tenax]|uniref:DUF1570 domain-containing protein n=2 Tax=Rubripirellula tenax TaxID=2528015 RepID=A0A5C6F526_9BACT|nr:hypothetical protein Poly51_27810 [Rubripirellula tenax]